MIDGKRAVTTAATEGIEVDVKESIMGALTARLLAS